MNKFFFVIQKLCKFCEVETEFLNIYMNFQFHTFNSESL